MLLVRGLKKPTDPHALWFALGIAGVIASYTLLSAVGRLDVKTLGLDTPDYLPEVHYHQVRDAWHGLRTPSGR